MWFVVQGFVVRNLGVASPAMNTMLPPPLPSPEGPVLILTVRILTDNPGKQTVLISIIVIMQQFRNLDQLLCLFLLNASVAVCAN